MSEDKACQPYKVPWYLGKWSLTGIVLRIIHHNDRPESQPEKQEN